MAALLYPVALLALYGAGRLVHEARSVESTLSAWAVTLGAAALVYSVPAIALWAIRVLGQEQHPSPAHFRARGFASPPLFTAPGVALYLVHSSGDHVAWALIWLPIVVVAVIGQRRRVQIVSGIVLLRRRIGAPDGKLGSLQTASGAYLAAFIASHLMAVFILGRQFLHVDTNWDFAVGPGRTNRRSMERPPHPALFARRFPSLRARHMWSQSGSARSSCDATHDEPDRRMILGAVMALTITLAMLGLHASA